jgi:predicted DNA-binding protein (MmcQ/YjbR family)
MNFDSLRAYCLSLPHCSEKVQWEDDLLFTIGGKMFVVASFEPGPFVATLKPEPEHRLELLEIEGVEPAPYLARAGWISMRQWDTLRDPEWRDLVSESYRMVLAKLPRKLQATIAGTPAPQASQPGSAKKASVKQGSAATAAKKPAGKSRRMKTQPQAAATKNKATTASPQKRAGGTKRAGKSAAAGKSAGAGSR